MTRYGLCWAIVALALLTGCGGGGGGNGFTTPDGDPFGEAFQYFFGGGAFPTPPASDTAARDAIAADRGTPDTESDLSLFWNFESYNRPQITIERFEDEFEGLAINYECESTGCDGIITHAAADFDAIFEAARDLLIDRFGTPDDTDVSDGTVTVTWLESAFEIVLTSESSADPSSGDDGGVDVEFNMI